MSAVAMSYVFYFNGQSFVCPAFDVTPQEFRKRAMLARWQDETITLFLSAPLCYEYVKVGNEALRIRR